MNIVLGLIGLLALVFLGAVIWLSTLPAEFEVVRSRRIKASPERLFDIVRDLRTWNQWSPWLMHEPETKLNFSNSTDQEGSWYSWDGKIVGAGTITHIKLAGAKSIDQKITFTRPMRSSSDVYWRFEGTGDESEVRWGMRGRMPLFFRWMCSLMDQWVGKDYEIGLALLAIHAGDHSQVFRFEFPGEAEIPAEQYIGLHYEGTIKNISDVMKSGFPKVMDAVRDHGLEINGAPFSQYHAFNAKKDFISCDMAIPVASAKPIDGFITGQRNKQKCLRMVVRGDYSILELAWHAAIGHMRMLKRKPAKGVPMLERYVTDPCKSHGLDLVTHIDLPLSA